MDTLAFPLFALLVAASLQAGCDGSGPGTTPPKPAPPFEEVESFATYFAGRHLDTLSTFDLAILDPDAFPEDAVQALRESGTLTVAYVNLGEAETYRWFYDQVQEDWKRGANPNWDDHFYIDARAEGWQTLLLDTVLPRIVEKGYDGLFFDMVDTALPALFPETRPGMVRLIERIRARYPDLRLLMNNGLFLMDDVGPLLDGSVVEGVFTRYRFDTETYVRTDSAARDARVEQLRQVQDRYGLKVFSINYATPGDSALRDYARRQARQNGFIPFVSTLALDTIGVAPPAQPDS